VALLGVVLASLARLDEVSGIGMGGRPITAVSKGLSHELLWMSTNADVDVEEQLPPIFWGDAPQEHFIGALAIELPAEDSVVLRMPDQPASVGDVDENDPPLKEVE